MYRINSRFICLCLGIIFCTIVVHAQQREGNYSVKKANNDTPQASESGIISPEERAKLEKKFSGANYHINDEGVVVYTPDPVSSNESTAKKSNSTAFDNASSANNGTDDQSIIKENQLLKDRTIDSSQYSEPEDSEFVKKNKTIVVAGNSGTVDPSGASAEMYAADVKPAKVNLPLPVKTVEKKNVAEKQKAPVSSNTENSAVVKEKVAETKNVSQKSGFGKSEPSRYKSLEEAYMETEALIKKLQKDSSSDLTNRVKDGSKTSSTKVSNNGQYDNFLDSPQLDADVQAALYEKFGNEPSYFIDGVQVEKKDFLRVRDKDVVSRTIKTKDTVTANPNGEIWIETKRDNR